MTWAEIISDLTAAGFSQTQLAEACDCVQSTISDLANGRNTDPRTSIADALRRLHAAEQKKPRAKAGG